MTEKVTDNPLQPRQTAAIAALLRTGKVADAAKAGSVTPKTVYAWLRQPAFAAALRAAESDALRGLARRLVGLGDAAADVLRDALADDQPMPTRLRAAALVLERGPVLFELTNLLERIEALEHDHSTTNATS